MYSYDLNPTANTAYVANIGAIPNYVNNPDLGSQLRFDLLTGAKELHSKVASDVLVLRVLFKYI